MLCIFQVLPCMRQRRQGCIINIASRAGTVAMPFAGAYCSGKGALIRAVSCLQKELEMDGFADSIHVYALHPGATLSQTSCEYSSLSILSGSAISKVDMLSEASAVLCGCGCGISQGSREMV